MQARRTTAVKVFGDINLATALTMAAATAIIAWVVARATTTRQARAVQREEARRAIRTLITPTLGHVRLTLSACHGLSGVMCRSPWVRGRSMAAMT